MNPLFFTAIAVLALSFACIETIKRALDTPTTPEDAIEQAGAELTRRNRKI